MFMRLLLIHSNKLDFKATKKAMKDAQLAGSDEGHYGECLVAFWTAEDTDTNIEQVAQNAYNEITSVASQIQEKRVILYPYVHLLFGAKPAGKELALDIEAKLENLLKADFEVHKAPFGFYKSFGIECKGHPLSELSRVITAEPKEKERKEGSEFVRFVLVDTGGKEYEITAENWDKCELFRKEDKKLKILRQFVKNELAGKSEKEMPKHIELMKHLELVDYCDVSDAGHFKWYPKGCLMQDLIMDYAFHLATKWGAMKMKNPLLIRSDQNEVGQLMKEFHERDYWVIGGNDKFLLRYASDPLGFPFMQKVQFSHKQSPLKVYEEATCFRREKKGELSGLQRVRNFLMTDMHAACATEAEAKKEFEYLCYKFGDLMNDVIADGRWVLGWEGTVEFFEKNKNWLIEIGTKMKVPAFFKLMPEMSHYYAIKNEYQTVTEQGANIQVSTVQWDVKDGERFGIGYIDSDGKKKNCPVILHASSFGSIERTLASLLENSYLSAKEAGKHAILPLWLSPTQIRLCPVSDEYLNAAEEFADKLEKHNIRVDIDDRAESIPKKVRNAETEWAPLIIVFGEKEKSGDLMVRFRETGKTEKMDFNGLVKCVADKTTGMPFRPLPVPRLMTKQVKFVG
jgi:threonyl-tRNA synthetase